MAKVIHGPLISDARCKVGGIVFSRARHGPYTRAWVVPINPNTDTQADRRANFTACLLRWQTELTDLQRLAWGAFARRFPNTMPLSGTRPLSGCQQYIATNMIAWYDIGIWCDDPPLDQNVRQLEYLLLNTNDSATQTLTFTAGITPTENELLYIYATLPLSAGIMNFRRYLRQVCFFDCEVIYPADLYTPWHEMGWYVTDPPPPHYVNPDLIAGKRIGIQAYIVNMDNYALSHRLSAQSITT